MRLWINFPCFHATESDNLCSGEATARQPPKSEWFCRWSPQTIALSLSFLTVLLVSLSLLVVWEGTWRPFRLQRYSSSSRIAHPYMLSPDSLLCLPAISRAWWRCQERGQTVGSYWNTKASMPSTGPYIPQTWIQMRTYGMLVHLTMPSNATDCPGVH